MANNMLLKDIRVLDATTLMAGPLMSSLLGDFGAEILKVERPGGDVVRKWNTNLWKVSNRNKKCITLDFHKAEGRELFYKLVKKSDVVILNFRPETIKKWHLDYEDLIKVKKNIIMMHFTAFGRTGPYKERPGFARVAEAFSGLTYVTGYPDRAPVLSGYAILDAIGGVYGAFSIMLAIHHLKNTNEGQLIDLSLYEPMVRIMEDYIIDYDLKGSVRERNGNANPLIAPNDIYETKDKKWIVIPATTQSMFIKLMNAIGHPELINDDRFKNNEVRVLNRSELDKYLVEFFSSYQLDEVIQILKKFEVVHSKINSVEDIMHDPHVNERKNIISVFDSILNKEIKMQGIVPKLSKTPGKVKWSGPEVGSYNEEIYHGLLGLSKSEIDSLTKLGVI